jgi:very-short-patch-repair endonuclease
MKRRVPLGCTQRARHLRAAATKQERILWNRLSRYRPKFTRQLPIGPYVVDLACRRAKLVVEVDGSQHIDREADIRRTFYLEAEGWTVIRF